MKRPLSAITLLTLSGIVLIVLYGVALWLNNLRINTIPFELVFFTAFAVYGLAVWWVLQDRAPVHSRLMILIFGFAIFFRAVLVFSQPTLSDDMYRYIWDGRVQAHHINPYSYAPAAPQLAGLRDESIWPEINRKAVVTVYPAGAELAFAAIWRIWPDSVHFFQLVMVFGDLMAAVLLFFLLRATGRPTSAVLIYLWNPLVIFEIASSAHVDGLVLPFLLGAWLARIKGRDFLTGLLLGLAASLKLYPLLLLPVLWRWKDERGRFRPAWSMPLAFLIGFGITYLPYLSIGGSVVGFLPGYLNEQFNFMLSGPIFLWAVSHALAPELVVDGFMAAVLLIIYLFFLFHPAANAETALRRCIWPVGAFTLLTTNLFPWYMLWLVPLLAIFLPRRASDESRKDFGRRLLRTSWSGWWLFCGLVGLAYNYYIHWATDLVAIYAQFIPLYEFLLIDLGRWLLKIIPRRLYRRRTA
ncbi:MAG: hypothetical protein P4L50_23525 [Anaerolineaceae bacterium]|nr:hypothetical protein [Anaerolineaceae bacterium]